MTPEQFAYWLQGFVELNPSMQQPTPEQWKAIGEHLQTVFVKVTPSMLGSGTTQVGALDSKVVQNLLQEVRQIRQSQQVQLPQSGTGLVDFSRGGQYPGGLAIC